MNINQTSLKSLNEFTLYDHHEASKGNEVGDGALDGPKDRRLKLQSGGVVLASYNGGWDVRLSGDRKPLRIRFVGYNVVNPEAMLLLNQGLKIRASAG